MKHLWSPWRLEYLVEPKPEGCIFCEAAASEEDRANLVLFRGRHAFLILNRFPYNNGHLMAVSYAHVPSLEDLETATLTEMMWLVNRGLAALRATMRPQGFNVGANLGQVAGAGMEEHVHMHVVPRWAGDTNYMAVVGNTRVVPDSLDALYDELVSNAEKMGLRERAGPGP